jgi:hypothetical protein
MGGAGCLFIARGCMGVTQHRGMRSVRVLLHHKRTSYSHALRYAYPASERMLAVQFFVGTRPRHERYWLSSTRKMGDWHGRG